MPSDSPGGGRARADEQSFNSVEYLLFDSLVHHLIEKGILTKNDALSVVQIAAEVVRGRIHESGAAAAPFEVALETLERTYSSFEALPDRNGAAHADGHNIHPLRPPLHGQRPRFPSDED